MRSTPVFFAAVGVKLIQASASWTAVRASALLATTHDTQNTSAGSARRRVVEDRTVDWILARAPQQVLLPISGLQLARNSQGRVTLMGRALGGKRVRVPVDSRSP
jgi:hypothetical protein